MSSGIDVPMNDRAKELNCPKRFYQGQAGPGGWLLVHALGIQRKQEPGPYDGIDEREEALKAARAMWADAAARGEELPPAQRPRH